MTLFYSRKNGFAETANKKQKLSLSVARPILKNGVPEGKVSLHFHDESPLKPGLAENGGDNTLVKIR